MKQFQLLALLLSLSLYAAEDQVGYTEIECDIVVRARHLDHEQKGNKASYSRPHIGIADSNVSSNWSGYVAFPSIWHYTNGAATAVYGSWIVPAVAVPTVTAGSQNTYSSFWVGIDGYETATVEQIGTSQEWINGAPVYYAWFEMYPDAAYYIAGFPVHPGDSISASVEYQGNGVFLMKLYNNTLKISTTIPTSSTTSSAATCDCVEWIAEAPSINGTVQPLSHFGTAQFSNCTATINGVTGPINNSSWTYEALSMKRFLFLSKATPSSLGADGASFSVQWYHE
jgi:hypothetical protein